MDAAAGRLRLLLADRPPPDPEPGPASKPRLVGGRLYLTLVWTEAQWEAIPLERRERDHPNAERVGPIVFDQVPMPPGLSPGP